MNSNFKQMNTRIFKLIIGGALFGAALFFVPFFLLKVAGFFLVLMLVIWLFKGGRRHHERKLAWVDHIRSMSDEEYEAWKSHRGRCGHHRNVKKHENE